MTLTWDMAPAMRPLVDRIDGFLSVERFQSLTNPDNLLSVSVFRDEAPEDSRAVHQAGSEQ